MFNPYGKAVLLEINRQPAMQAKSLFDKAVKINLLENVFHLGGIRVPNDDLVHNNDIPEVAAFCS